MDCRAREAAAAAHDLSCPIEERIIAPMLRVRAATIACGDQDAFDASGILKSAQTVLNSATGALSAAARAERATSLPILASTPAVTAFLRCFNRSWVNELTSIVTSIAGVGPDICDEEASITTDILSCAHIAQRACRDLAIYKSVAHGEVLTLPRRLRVAPLIAEIPALGKVDDRWTSLAIDFDDDPIPAEVTTPESHLAYILFALLENAIRWSPKADRINVTARRDKAHTLIMIAGGRPHQVREEAFLPFWRLNSGCRYPGNLGLGLPTARQLARINRGDIVPEPDSITVILPNRQDFDGGTLSAAGHA